MAGPLSTSGWTVRPVKAGMAVGVGVAGAISGRGDDTSVACRMSGVKSDRPVAAPGNCSQAVNSHVPRAKIMIQPIKHRLPTSILFTSHVPGLPAGKRPDRHSSR